MKLKRNKFTLVELLVAMLVFSIMLVMMMRLFTGAQRVWVGSSEKNQVYGNSRIAMDMMATLLQSIYYAPDSKGSFYFRIVKNDTPKCARIYFAAKTDYSLPGNKPVRFLSFQVPNQFDSTYPKATYGDYYNKLMMTVVSDAGTDIDPDNIGEKQYQLWFPEYVKQSGATEPFDDKRDRLYGLLDSKIISTDAKADYCRSAILKNVVGFEVNAFKSDGTKITDTPQDLRTDTAYLEIRMFVLSDEKFAAWKELYGSGTAAEKLAAKNFRLLHQYEFFRRVYIGDLKN